MKILQVNILVNSGSTGRIAEDIGKEIILNNGESYIAYGRKSGKTKSIPIKIGTSLDQAFHLFQSRIFDNHGLSSTEATKRFCQSIESINPDIVHLHNIHGYYLNYKTLFNYLNKNNTPVVWTLHDCWAFTGHCSHFDHINCNKWQDECNNCPLKKRYPASYVFDNSRSNYMLKKRIFLSHENINLVPVSDWLKGLVQKSFFRDKRIEVIKNGIDLDIFRPKKSSAREKYNLGNGKLILGVSNVWSSIKGLKDFVELREVLNEDHTIVLVGLSNKQMSQLPRGIVGIPQTENIEELAELYSTVDVFVNLSTLETFGLVTAESMACGTPVVVYNATASPELVSHDTGKVVEKHNIQALNNAIEEVLRGDKEKYSQACRKRAVIHFDKNVQTKSYINLYESILRKF